LRTPLLIRWPDGTGAGRVDGQVARIYDIYPTLLGRLGVAAPAGLDGRDLSQPGTAAREQFWEVRSGGPYSYSVLRDGRWRMNRGSPWIWVPWHLPPELYDVATSPSVLVDVAAQHPDLVVELEQQRRDWQRAVHRPALQLDHDASGAGSLRGLDFLRTPGFGGFSFAIAFGSGFAGRLAAQQGVWSLEAGADGEVQAAFGPHRLAARPPPGECHSAIVSGWFSRRISALPGSHDSLQLSLFLDGAEAQSLEAQARIDDANFSAPTQVGVAGNAASNRLLSRPLLLTMPLGATDAWNATDLHRELCADLAARGSAG
jgi:hypothetical protein